MIDSKRTLINLDAQLVSQGMLDAEQAATQVNVDSLTQAELQQPLLENSSASAAPGTEVHVKQEMDESNLASSAMEVS